MNRTLMTALFTLSTIACSGSGPRHTDYRYQTANDPATNEPANVVPGPMPASESFTGSYHSQQIGDIFLDEQGDTVIGTYEYDRASCHATGRIEGRRSGNLLHFSWTESQAECGRLAPLTGHGYFLFWKDSGENGRINGEWGLGQDESGGGPWSGFRDRVRRQPQRRNATPGGGGVFDEGASSGGSATPGAAGAPATP